MKFKVVQIDQDFCNLTSWGISWSRMAKVVRKPTCKKSLINTFGKDMTSVVSKGNYYYYY